MAKKSTAAPEETPFDFEQALQELETLVETMEHGELTLEQSLRDFERGIQLTRRCQQALSEAEQRVQVLVERNGRETLAPFETDAEES